LKWKPKWNLQLTLKSIVDWHQVYSNGGDIKKQCLKEINTYST
jgi:CDP-glucose 4,6-dehydratase